MRVPFAVRLAGSSPRDCHARTVAGVTFLLFATSEASMHSSFIVASLLMFVAWCFFMRIDYQNGFADKGNMTIRGNIDAGFVTICGQLRI